MNVLCLFQKFDLNSSTIYLDLVNELSDRGHIVNILALTSDREKAGFTERTGNIRVANEFIPDQFHTNKIKKGLIQLLIGRTILKGVKKHFWSEKADIIIYPTPPVTLSGILRPLKQHYGAVNYLMLKDIFPQNAVDLHMMKEGGLLHRLFKKMERELYRESDVIGCMSKGNLEYIKSHEPEVDPSKLEIFPNTVKVIEVETDRGDPHPSALRAATLPSTDALSASKRASKCSTEAFCPRGGKADEPEIQEDFPVRFIFGGNLGKPQAVDFLMGGIAELKDDVNAEFIFIGSGTEEDRIRSFIRDRKIDNLKLYNELPRREYEKVLKDADIGIVSLSPYFTIPNYPSRILSYMQLSKPVLAVTDRVTDIKELVTEEARCGWWCPSDDRKAFTDTVKKIVSERELFKEYGKNGREYLKKYFNVERSAEILERHCHSERSEESQ